MPIEAEAQLLDAIPVTIEDFDKKTTRRSKGLEGRREHFGTRAKKVLFTLQAQIVFTDGKQITEFTEMGRDTQTKGYILVLDREIKAKGVTIKHGQKIKKFGKRDVKNLFITQDVGDLAAHFDTTDNHELIKIFFTDRSPKGS